MRLERQINCPIVIQNNLPGAAVVGHINVRRMWEYAHNKLDLSFREVTHISECTLCFNLFNLCAKTDDPQKIARENRDKKDKRRTA